MIPIKTSEEIEIMRHSAQLASRTLGVLAESVQPGITPLELDKIAEEFIRDHDAVPGFLGLYDFPNSLCTSINEEVVHGIPSKYELQEGDIITLDCGVLKNGFYGDQAFTFEVGEVTQEIRQLLRITRESLELGIQQARAGNRIGDIGFTIQQHAEAHGYGVVRELVGHGLGKQMHEKPEVPNYGKRGRGPVLKNGMVLAIEPMINMGTRRVRQASDGWTIVTADKKPAAHFEHDVAIVNDEPEILTTFQFVDEALQKIAAQ